MDGVPANSVHLSHKHALNIGMVPAFPGNVPTYEEHDARVAAGYTLTEWYRLHYFDRALEVAHFRYRKLVKAMAEEKASKGK